MNNPLVTALGLKPQSAAVPQMQNGFMSLLDRLNQFRETFSGDPKQTVQQLLNSGRMTQAQYNQLSSAATQIQRMLGGR